MRLAAAKSMKLLRSFVSPKVAVGSRRWQWSSPGPEGTTWQWMKLKWGFMIDFNQVQHLHTPNILIGYKLHVLCWYRCCVQIVDEHEHRITTADIVELDSCTPNDEYFLTTGLTLVQVEKLRKNRLTTVRPIEIFSTSVRLQLAVASLRQRFSSEPTRATRQLI